jgi:hypothetical protein
VSLNLKLPDFDGPNNTIRPNASISIGELHCSISRLRLWLYNDELPYRGSSTHLEGVWGGKQATLRPDWCLGTHRYGLEQVSYIDAQGQLAGKARYGDLPGIYYRYFEWWNCPSSYWTLAVTLWYPAIFFAILPCLWLAGVRSLPKRFSLRGLFLAVTLVGVVLGLVVSLRF